MAITVRSMFFQSLYWTDFSRDQTINGSKVYQMFTIFCIIYIVLLLSKNTRVHQSEEKDTKFSVMCTPF